jgi:hypothetical protein
MAQVVDPASTVLEVFNNQESAQQALQVLSGAGFASEKFSIVAQDPTIPETEAKQSGAQGAIAGSLFGAFIGLFLSYIKDTGVNQAPTVDPISNTLGMVLAGSLVGAAGIGLMAAITGGNVRRKGGKTEAVVAQPDFFLLAKDLPDEDIVRIKTMLQTQFNSAS